MKYTMISSHATSASAASASAASVVVVVVATVALDGVLALDQPAHAVCVAPDMYMLMLDMWCASPSQFIATECSIALASAAA